MSDQLHIPSNFCGICNMRVLTREAYIIPLVAAHPSCAQATGLGPWELSDATPHPAQAILASLGGSIVWPKPVVPPDELWTPDKKTRKFRRFLIAPTGGIYEITREDNDDGRQATALVDRDPHGAGDGSKVQDGEEGRDERDPAGDDPIRPPVQERPRETYQMPRVRRKRSHMREVPLPPE